MLNVRSELESERYKKPRRVPDEERRCGEGTCGIDLGLSTFATIYYGNGEVEKVHAPRPLRRMLHRLRCLSKSLARKSKGSHNWYKAKRRIGSAALQDRLYPTGLSAEVDASSGCFG